MVSPERKKKRKKKKNQGKQEDAGVLQFAERHFNPTQVFCALLHF